METNEYLSRIAALRQHMSAAGVDAFIIPSADPHQSEYPADRWKSRAWISGFTGSAGTAVITTSTGGVWTDSRYFLQAADELKVSGLQLFKDGLPETPSLQDWLAGSLAGRSHKRHRRDDLLLHRRRTSESIFTVERLSFQNGFRTVRQNLERATRSTDQPSICLSDRIQWKKFPRKMERSIARHRRERRKCHSHLRTRRTGMVAQYPRKRCNIQSWWP